MKKAKFFKDETILNIDIRYKVKNITKVTVDSEQTRSVGDHCNNNHLQRDDSTGWSQATQKLGSLSSSNLYI